MNLASPTSGAAFVRTSCAVVLLVNLTSSMRRCVSRGEAVGSPRNVVLERSIHQAVADHLAALPWSDSPGIDADPLRESELMHHLIGAGDAEHVAQLLADYSGPYALRSATGYSAKAPAIQSLAHHLSGADRHIWSGS